MAKVKVVCQSCKGEQTISVEGMSPEMVKDWAGLVDGTSPFFIYSPRGDDTSLIGRCGICKGQIDAEVLDE